ncbi:MAG: hypothetical protein SFY32_04550 [Bacteroidota bacterium]|nr:hypothetical protein [Bacteroidota bacterium]
MSNSKLQYINMTCGYVCPVCEGKGFDENTLENCDYCNKTDNIVKKQPLIISDEQWIDAVHNNCPCGNYE